jgi:hypothetical protein
MQSAPEKSAQVKAPQFIFGRVSLWEAPMCSADSGCLLSGYDLQCVDNPEILGYS